MGILSIFKKKPEVEESNKSMIAMIALSSPVFPEQNQLFDFLRSNWPEAPLPKDISNNSQILTFDLGKAIAAVSLMPAPIPWEDLEGPCATAWYWPEATQAMKDHKYHLIVALMKSPLDIIDTTLLFTKLVASVAASVNADGVYWGAGTLVHSPDVFIEQSKEMSREYLPLYLWIDFRVQKENAEKYTLFTTGMKSLGLMEIEIINSESEPSVLIDRAFNIAHYLLDYGPIIKDGNTIGLSEEEKILVRHVPSIFEASRKVYRLEF